MTMKDKLFHLVKRLRLLLAEQKDLDFRISVWCRDARACFPDGERGDQCFVDWCVEETGVTSAQAREFILRATAAKVVPDEQTWKRLNGYKQIGKLEGLPRRDQVSILEAAKSTGRAVQTLVRKHRAALEPVDIAPPARPTPSQDARRLADYIRNATHGKLPKIICEILERYPEQVQAVKAAA